MTKRKSKAEKDQAEHERTTHYVNHMADIVNSVRELNTDCPSCGGDCCDGHVETTAEYVKRVGKSIVKNHLAPAEELIG